MSKVLFCVSEVRKTFQWVFSFLYKVLSLFSELSLNFIQAAEHSVIPLVSLLGMQVSVSSERNTTNWLLRNSVPVKESRSGCGLKGGKVSFLPSYLPPSEELEVLSPSVNQSSSVNFAYNLCLPITFQNTYRG